MDLPRQQERNTKLIPLLIHLYILLPVIKRARQVHTIAPIVPREFREHIVIAVGRFDP